MGFNLASALALGGSSVSAPAAATNPAFNRSRALARDAQGNEVSGGAPVASYDQANPNGGTDLFDAQGNYTGYRQPAQQQSFFGGLKEGAEQAWQNNWPIILGAAGGAYLSGPGAATEGLSGMDLAADAGTNGGNSIYNAGAQFGGNTLSNVAALDPSQVQALNPGAINPDLAAAGGGSATLTGAGGAGNMTSIAADGTITGGASMPSTLTGANGAIAQGLVPSAGGAAASWIPGVSNATALLGVSQLAGSLLSANASSKAAAAQMAAAQSSNATQLAMFNQLRADQEPWRVAGGQAVGNLSQLSQLPASDPLSLQHQFGAADLNANLAPNYQWQMDQGLQAANNQASMHGGLGGNALAGAQQYAQGLAGNAYQQAYNNYNTNQTNIFNRLSGIAGLGQVANGQNSQNGVAAANGISSGTLASGAAQAAGYMGQANAFSNGISNLSNMYMMNNMTGGKIFGQPGTNS